MKKGKLKKILTSTALGVCACAMPFALTGCFGEDKDISVRVEGDYIQWQVEGEDDWTNLITIDEILNSIGDEIKGDKVEIQKTDTHIQWRYEGGEWQNLIALEDIKGEDLVAEECMITYDFNLGGAVSTSVNNQLLSVFDKDGFDKQTAEVVDDQLILKYTQLDEKGNYFNLYNFEEIGLGDYFLGWYVDDVKVNKLHTIGGNIELKAKWTKDISSLICTEKAKYVYNDKKLEVAAFPLTNVSYVYYGGVRSFELKDLTIYEGKFYKITEFSWYQSRAATGERLVDVIYVPDTAVKMMDSMINTPGPYQDVYFLSNNYDEENDLYYIGDYVICDNLTKYGTNSYVFGCRTEWIYKVNYETSQATLVNCRALQPEGYYADGEDQRVNGLIYSNTTSLLNFSINNNGVHNITVTEINRFWMRPWNVLQRDGYGLCDCTSGNIKINFIISEDIESIGGPNWAEPVGFDDSIFFDKNDEPKYSVDFNFFSLKTTPHEEFKDEQVGGYYVLPTYYKFYYYSETQPTDTEHKYWHYDEDGDPVIWEVETSE